MSFDRSGVYGLLIGAAFTGHLVNVVVLEPGLGFAAPADFYDFDRIRPQLTSWLWYLGALYHGIAAFSLVAIAVNKVRKTDLIPSTAAQLGSVFAVMSALCFLVVAMINVSGFRELAHIAVESVTHAQSGYFGLLVLRASVLTGALVALGGALVSLAIADWKAPLKKRYLICFQFLLGCICLAFLAWPAIAPVLIVSVIVWGFWSSAGNISRDHSVQS